MAWWVGESCQLRACSPRSRAPTRGRSCSIPDRPFRTTVGDPLLVTWLLWWSTHVMPLTTAWWNAPAFYPAPGVFAFSENLLGLAPVTWPIIAVTGAPVLAYNAAFVLSYVCCGLGAYFLGFVLTRRHDAAFVAAVAFAFAPYRLSHTHHLQLLSAYWMPVAIGALHLYLADRRSRAGPRSSPSPG